MAFIAQDKENEMNYEEGPFIGVRDGYRIHVQVEKHPYPIDPHKSIRRFLEEIGKPYRTTEAGSNDPALRELQERRITEVVDILNSMVKNGQVAQRDQEWVSIRHVPPSRFFNPST